MKFILLVSIFVFLSACSRIDLAVSYAPRYIANEVDNAFDLSSDRYKKIKQSISADIDKNKVSVFSDLIVHIEYIQLLTDKQQLQIGDIRYLHSKAKDIQSKIIESFKPTFSEILLNIVKSEVTHLVSYTDNKFKKASENFIEKDDYYKHYFKTYDKAMSYLFDTSTKEQDKLYKDFLDTNFEYYKMQLANRKLFMTEFENLADKKNELLNISMQFYSGKYIANSETYKKRQDLYYESLDLLITQLWNSATAKQKLYFKKTMEKLKDELRNIIKSV